MALVVEFYSDVQAFLRCECFVAGDVGIFSFLEAGVCLNPLLHRAIICPTPQR